MGLFEKKTESIREWSDRKLLKELDKPSRDILSTGRLVEEAARRGLTNPKTGKPFRT